MLASEVIALAKASELKQLAVKSDDTAILGFINLGILELYKKFPLKQEEAIITLSPGKATYTLDGTDADVSMGSADNFLVVSEAYDEDGEIIVINDENDPLGVLTPSYNTVEIPTLAGGEKIALIYRSAPAFITQTTDTLDLPYQLLEALLHYIGYRGHSTVTADVKAENNTHYIRFIKSCDDVLTQGLILPDDMESYTFEQRGFV
jgi:hypothetical protein